jgi:tetratricopeptide (TPR) repeat protein
MTQYGLGWALSSLDPMFASSGEREGGTARLEEAVAAFRAALQVHTREQAPLRWAATQNGLGYALTSLGQALMSSGDWEGGTARLEEAVGAFRSALQVFEVQTRERVPLDWADTQYGLAYALMSLGKWEDGTAILEESVAAFRAALEEYRVAGATDGIEMAEWYLQETEALLARRRTP